MVRRAGDGRSRRRPASSNAPVARSGSRSLPNPSASPSPAQPEGRRRRAGGDVAIRVTGEPGRRVGARAAGVAAYDAPVDDRAAAEGLIAAGRRLGARGLISAGEGNLSVRLDADRLLMTPTGLRKDELGDGRSGRRLARPPRARGALAERPRPVVRPGHPSGGARRATGYRGRRPRPPAGIDEPHPGGRDPGPGRLAGDGLPPAAPAVPRLRRDGQSGAGRSDRRGAGRPAGWGRTRRGRGPPRAARRGGGRSRPGARGQPPRARRGPVPDVARRAPDSRGAGSVGIVEAPRPSATTEGA